MRNVSSNNQVIFYGGVQETCKITNSVDYFFFHFFRFALHMEHMRNYWVKQIKRKRKQNHLNSISLRTIFRVRCDFKRAKEPLMNRAYVEKWPDRYRGQRVGGSRNIGEKSGWLYNFQKHIFECFIFALTQSGIICMRCR